MLRNLLTTQIIDKFRFFFFTGFRYSKEGKEQDRLHKSQ